jgi:hypothetical protein
METMMGDILKESCGWESTKNVSHEWAPQEIVSHTEFGCENQQTNIEPSLAHSQTFRSSSQSSWKFTQRETKAMKLQDREIVNRKILLARICKASLEHSDMVEPSRPEFHIIIECAQSPVAVERKQELPPNPIDNYFVDELNFLFDEMLNACVVARCCFFVN